MRKYKLFIGIDISKNWIDVCFSLNGKKSEMPHARFSNDKKGFAAMLKFLKSSGQYSKGLKQCIFCMEHTGVYSLALCRFLEKKKAAFYLVSPHHLVWSLGLRRGKNDIADARDIARYIFLHHQEVKLSKLPSDKLLTIKNLLSLRSRLVDAKKGLSVAEKELRCFDIKATSRQVSKCTKSTLKPIKKNIVLIEKKIKTLIEQDTELDRLFQLATSVKGVGLIIAAHLLVCTVGFTAFENSRKFATYIGLAPFAHSSGTSVNRPAQVSHLAHKKLKGVISCGASSAKQHDKELKAYYHRRLEEGKNKHSINNAIRNKFIHRIFAVIKRGTPYVELAQFRK